jgi:hypothetical protein
MRNPVIFVGLVALGLTLMPGAARADRIPSSKVQITPQPGVRPQIIVPYLTNNGYYSNLGVWQGVAPRIYDSPIQNDPRFPDSLPTYNLPFWGGFQAFGDLSNGATPRAGLRAPVGLIR